MKTGNGKIANLPPEIRDELNYRINDGEPGNDLVDWLNSKPEVIKVIHERFDGTAPSLSGEVLAAGPGERRAYRERCWRRVRVRGEPIGRGAGGGSG
jgi:hypothetical protein